MTVFVIFNDILMKYVFSIYLKLTCCMIMSYLCFFIQFNQLSNPSAQYDGSGPTPLGSLCSTPQVSSVTASGLRAKIHLAAPYNIH